MPPAIIDRLAVEPPEFVRLVAHPVRWQLLHQLVRSDRAVRELTELVGEPQNLVSYHLRQLRDGGLVSARRSSADGRDTLLRDRPRRAAAISSRPTGGALHPALVARAAPHRSDASGVPRSRRRRVLFLCTGNSARSQIAEALIEHMSGGAVEASSAGSHPKPLHPERGARHEAARDRHQREPHQAPRRVRVATLRHGDHAVRPRPRGLSRSFRPIRDRVHWSMPDPALEGETDRASYPAFERTATELETRIRFLLPVLTAPTTTRSHRHAKR